MATSRVLSTEDGNLSSSNIISSRTKDYSDVDLSFVPKPNGDIFKKTDAAAVKQSVKNIILTNHFEKPFLPFFGGNVRSLLFELAYDDVGEETQENIKYKIIDPLIEHIAMKLQPYVLVIICVFTIFFILMIWILMIIIKTNSSDIKYKVTI